MKRVLIIMCIVCLGLGYGPVSAQWKDDIYYNSEDAKKEEEQQAAREQERMRRQQQQRQQNFSGQPDDSYGNDGGDYVRTYDSDDYIDYDDDPSYYATNIRRFNYPFYNMGFYSTFYDPYWYNPYWVDPYGGWSWWGRPGMSMGWGMGGPYWSSYWGWHTWYGYPGYYSGWGMGGWGGYYSGYWNGYYAGMYNGGGWGGGRAVTYGPRYSANGNYNTTPRRSNPRTAVQGGVAPQQSPVTSGSFQRRSNTELQRAAGRDNVNLRNNTAPSPRNAAPGARTTPAQRNGGQVAPNRGNTQPAPGRRQFIREDQGTTPVPNRNLRQTAPQRNTSPQQPQRIMNQPQQRQPMSQPRMSAPQRSSGGSMFRSGGSTGGGSRGGGGSIGGGSRSGGGRR